MASYISAKELKRRSESFTKIRSTCDTISQLKSGSSWVIIGYTCNSEFDSLMVLREGSQWNILLQILPSNEVCYVYLRVEFGKMPGACYLIIWTGEEVSEEKKLSAQENGKKIIDLFSNYEEIIYAHSQGNLNKQVAEHFKLNRTRHGSLKSGPLKKPQRIPKKEKVQSPTKNRPANFFLNSTEDDTQVNKTKLKSDIPKKTLHAKVIIIGDIYVGKSSLIRSYISGTEQTTTTTTTISPDYYTKIIPSQDNISLNLEIWDTIGEEKYVSLAPIWYRYAAAALLVYDKTDKESYRHIEDWLDRIKAYCEPYITILVGHKSDLLEEEVVKKPEGLNYAFEKGMMFTETSIKDVKSIEQTFNLLSKRLVPKLLELEKGSQCYNRCRGKTMLTVEPEKTENIDMMSSFKLSKRIDVKADNNSSKCC